MDKPKPFIPYPEKVSEFEIQSELFSKLKNAGFSVRGEVAGFLQECGCQMDIVVFDNLKRAIAIIECKNKRTSEKCGIYFDRYKTRQYFKYSQFGIPIFQCVAMDHVEIVFEAIQNLINELPFS